jgi:hypothetical protein
MKRPVSHLAVAAALLFALVATALPAGVVAGGSGQHTGRYGPHHLLDTSASPAVTCTYSPTSFLTTMRVRPPIMYALDWRLSEVDTQRVAWRYLIQSRDASVPSSAWQTISTSSAISATASDQAAAPFKARTHALSGQPDHLYRVVYRMLWYSPYGNGVAVHWPAHYRLVAGSETMASSRCPGFIS